jgi:hypothetical protein
MITEQGVSLPVQVSRNSSMVLLAYSSTERTRVQYCMYPEDVVSVEELIHCSR